MFTAPSAPFGQIPPPMASVVIHGVATGTTLGNIPPRMVPSPIVAPEVRNNTQGAAIPSYGNTGAVATFIAPPNYSALAVPAATPNHSVAFFAQLLAQSSPEDQLSVMRTFPDPVPFSLRSAAEPTESYAALDYVPRKADVPQAKRADNLAGVIAQAEQQPQRVYTRQYQMAQRLQSSNEQIKVDFSRLASGTTAQSGTVNGSAPLAGAVAGAMQSGAMRGTGPDQNRLRP